MLGYYDYTVVLTYLSLSSAVTGLFVATTGNGHPFYGMLFLMFCGLCDAFDGRVARRKKNRTEAECKFGIQIDSLSDLVAFGVLPVAIGVGLYRRMEFAHTLKHNLQLPNGFHLPYGILVAAGVVYVLTALIRLAYFNVTEEELQSESKKRTMYSGLPVIACVLAVPTFLLIMYFVNSSAVTLIGYPVLLLVMAGLFVSKLQVPKANFKWILIMIGIGVLELLIFVAVRLLLHHG